MKNVEIYTIDNCGFCERAKMLMKSRGVAFEEKLVDRSDDATVQVLFQRSRMRTFPQIFVGGKLVGGFTQLEALDREGNLAQALETFSEV